MEVEKQQFNSIALIGKPNSGKTLLFNRLTGLKQKVANYPGITTDIKVGAYEQFEIIDMPGIYTFDPLTADEAVTVDQIQNLVSQDKLKLLLFVLEATNLNASLSVVIQTLNKLGNKFPHAVVALNMMDEATKHGIKIDHVGLSNEIGIEIVPVSSKTGEGITDLKKVIHKKINGASSYNDTFKKLDCDSLTKKYKTEPKAFHLAQLKVDKIFLSPVFGAVVFVGLMLLLFQSIFTWAAPFMDMTESMIIFVSEFVTSRMSDGVFKDFVADGIFAGFGSFLVFVPQIFVLTFLVGLLEDSGYLARAALITHKPLSFFGLSGKSFIPYLTGHACAIPAIYASRTIESPIKRLLTQLTVPLMSCSARLPVYGLLIAAVIPAKTYLGGAIGLQGILFFAVYAVGILTALFVSVLTRPLFKTQLTDTPLILEMPPYRMPSLQSLVRKAYDASKKFIVKAGPIIFVVSIVVWFLGYFPQNEEGLAGSYLGQFGHFIEPVFKVIDVDWKYAVAILTSFLAREVFVGTLGTLFGIENADENLEGIISQVQASGLSAASGIALLVFFAIALQCVSTVAVLKQELKNSWLPWLTFAFYGVLAYGLSIISYFIAKAVS